ncbi:hypothetical protein QWY87_16795 [Lutimonas halocynthiae]|uniref:hypothetical protein n=1 Tax=Lutimonas halocynthiae TaxID=1446477 RepID=UPI0025B28BA1|nr:hypothetical protein [Lutimonas halocynthiae]MDN3644375.1 hypothetical protein [Lutimonas halocynthiae]
MESENTEHYLLQKKAKILSDLFATNEGRRPRILIGGEHTEVLNNSVALGNTFADLGCNVDIAPLHSDLAQLAKQSIENDVDIVLIIANTKVKKRELKKFEEIIFEQHPSVILSLCQDDSDLWTASETSLNQWILLDQSSDLISIVLKLLSKLLQIPG